MCSDGPLLMTKLEKRHLICVHVWNTVTEMFLFFCIFDVGGRDGDSIMGIKKKFLISYDKAILSH